MPSIEEIDFLSILLDRDLLIKEGTLIHSTFDFTLVETLDGINPDDYPDYADVYIYYAEWKDGTPLTNEELDKLNELDEFIDYAHERAHD